MEAIVLLFLLVTPWVFGGYDPKIVHFACCGLVALLLLWSIKQMVQWKLQLHWCLVSALLVVLFIVSALSLVALPRSTMQWISPEAARLYDALLPQQREKPVAEVSVEPMVFEPGTTLSLYPGTTQTALIELLAVIVLFFIVRHSLASPARLKRLAYAMVINGCILSIFALIQKVRAPSYTVYGISVPGEAFGPFINRNHFASYVNFCICLGLGLFLTSMQRRGGSYRTTAAGQRVPVSYSTGGFSEILQHPEAVWLLIPVAVCITAVLASLSRGGILSLLVAMGIAGLTWRRRYGSQNVWAMLAIPVVALGILLWYGATPTLERIEQEHTSTEGRFAIWKAGWDAFCKFPLVGTGFGTFSVVEPMYRPSTADQSMMHLHAHNEYMEALVEGGILRLAITLALVVVVLLAGWRALRVRQYTVAPALLLGAWAGCITLTVQSFGEFGIHLPAVAGILAVTGGYLVGLAPKRDDGVTDESSIQWHYFGVGPILGLFLAVSLGIVLFVGSRLHWESAGYREAGLILVPQAKAKSDPALYARAVQMFDGAIYYGPTYSRVRIERNEVEAQRLMMEQTRDRDLNNWSYHVHQLTRLCQGMTRLQLEPMALLTEDVMQPFLTQSALSQKHRTAQIEAWKLQQQHLLAARDLCPIAFTPQLEIAKHVLPRKAKLAEQDKLLYWKQADTLEAYLKRIKLLYPQRDDTWFMAGELEWNDGYRDEALRSWKHSLELSDQFLVPIVSLTTSSFLQPELKLTSADLMEKVLPATSTVHLVKAAWALYPAAGQTLERKPFMDKAIALLEKKKEELTPEDQYHYGLAKWGLNQREQGLQHLLTAVRGRPEVITWRVDLGRLYFELEKFSEAREQMLMVQQRRPNNLEAMLILKKLDELPSVKQ